MILASKSSRSRNAAQVMPTDNAQVKQEAEATEEQPKYLKYN